MSTFSDKMCNLVRVYQEESGLRWPATANDMASWAIDSGLWKQSKASIVGQCAKQISRALREEFFTDPQGRRVRAKHAAVLEIEGEQGHFWDDMRSSSRDYMELSFAQRRQRVIGDCQQLKTDVESYNDNHNTGDPIQMIFDFSLDLEEAAAAKTEQINRAKTTRRESTTTPNGSLTGEGDYRAQTPEIHARKE